MGLHWERSSLSFAVVYLPLILLVPYLARLPSSFFLILIFPVTLTWCIHTALQWCRVCALPLVLCLFSVVFMHLLVCSPDSSWEGKPVPTGAEMLLLWF